jgi:hypothetical protein
LTESEKNAYFNNETAEHRIGMFMNGNSQDTWIETLSGEQSDIQRLAIQYTGTGTYFVGRSK